MKSEVNGIGSSGRTPHYVFCDTCRIIHGLLHDKIFAFDDCFNQANDRSQHSINAFN